MTLTASPKSQVHPDYAYLYLYQVTITDLSHQLSTSSALTQALTINDKLAYRHQFQL